MQFSANPMANHLADHPIAMLSFCVILNSIANISKTISCNRLINS
jgi:hypothetical protein